MARIGGLIHYSYLTDSVKLFSPDSSSETNISFPIFCLKKSSFCIILELDSVGKKLILAFFNLTLFTRLELTDSLLTNTV